MRTLLKFILLFFCFSVLFVLPAVLIPLQVTMGNQSEYNSLMAFVLILSQFCVIIYLIKRLNLWGMKLFLSVVIVFWGLQTFMPQTETWYFRDAMPSISNGELLNLFLRPLITSITFIPLGMWVLGKWKPAMDRLDVSTPAGLNGKEIISLAGAYVVIYFVFGYFIAWQFEAVRIFYSGSPEDVGFIGGMKQNFQTRPFIFLFQLLRGFLWIIVGMPVLLFLKGTKAEKIVACALLYFLPALQLIVDNPFMPQPVRIAHLLEVASSNALFGWLIGYVYGRV
ncbi:MAG TPA: hypothetical protein VK658_19935 [Chryseolinea sp.]|nr:hypothetical protein [Chryseolinea sp.]